MFNEIMVINIMNFAPGLLCTPSDLGPMRLEEAVLPEAAEKLLVLAARFRSVMEALQAWSIVKIWLS